MIELEADSGCFTDSRDGQTYRAVKIGGKIWMAQNLNYLPQTGTYWLYGGDASNRDKYGVLYDWHTAVSVCPAGWHLPTRQEWADLTEAAGGGAAGRALKSTGGWSGGGGGDDGYGFSALPGGRRVTDGSFYGAGDYGYWWTATEEDDAYAYLRFIGCDGDAVNLRNGKKKAGLSVRCVQG